MKYFRYLTILVLLNSTSIAQAQNSKTKTISGALEYFNEALISGDSTQLAFITLPELSYGHSSGIVEDQVSFIHTLSNGISDFTKIEISNQNIRLHKNTAIIHHSFKATTNDKGVPGNINLNILLVWQKEKGYWKLLARQAAKKCS